MDRQLAQQFCGVVTTRGPDALLAAAQLLIGSGKSLTVRGARDSFSRIMREVRTGTPNVIGRKPDHMVVLISLEDLVEIVRDAAQPKSLAAALAEMGFDPVPTVLEISPERPEPSPELYSQAPSSTSGDSGS